MKNLKINKGFIEWIEKTEEGKLISIKRYSISKSFNNLENLDVQTLIDLYGVKK